MSYSTRAIELRPPVNSHRDLPPTAAPPSLRRPEGRHRVAEEADPSSEDRRLTRETHRPHPASGVLYFCQNKCYLLLEHN